MRIERDGKRVSWWEWLNEREFPLRESNALFSQSFYVSLRTSLSFVINFSGGANALFTELDICGRVLRADVLIDPILSPLLCRFRNMIFHCRDWFQVESRTLWYRQQSPEEIFDLTLRIQETFCCDDRKSWPIWRDSSLARQVRLAQYRPTHSALSYRRRLSYCQTARWRFSLNWHSSGEENVTPKILWMIFY